MVSWFSTRVSRPFNEERTVFSTTGDVTTEYPRAKEWSWTNTAHLIQKNQFKIDQRFKCKSLKYKALRIKYRCKSSWLELINDFWDMTPKAHAQKKNQIN